MEQSLTTHLCCTQLVLSNIRKKESTQTQGISQGYRFLSPIRKIPQINIPPQTEPSGEMNILVSSYMSPSTEQKCLKCLVSFTMKAPRAIDPQLVADALCCPWDKGVQEAAGQNLRALSFQEPMCHKDTHLGWWSFHGHQNCYMIELRFTRTKFSLLTPCLGEGKVQCWFSGHQARSSGPLSIGCLFSLPGALPIDAALSLWPSVGRLAAVHQMSEIKFSSATRLLYMSYK